MLKIVIVTSKSDLHADYVTRRLIDSGVPFARLNSDEMRQTLKVTYSLFKEKHFFWTKSGEANSTLVEPGEPVAVWYRKPLISRFDANSKQPTIAFMMRETEAYLADAITSLDAVRWINHPEANRLASNKLAQLRLAQSLGLRVPQTIVTNDPQSAVRFADSIKPAEVIYKTLTYPFIEETANTFRSVFTSVVRFSEEKLRAIEVAPCLFQEQIQKEYELRVTVVGQNVFAARIYSQDQEETALDWRRDQHKVILRQEVVALEPKVEQLCLEITKRLGLTFGAIDLIVTPEGEHVFVEINPNGQWLWKEILLGLEISGALIDELVR
jgi:glutathione synthase/RimK-type ligase-like ATP-grasp enzyme